MSPSLSASAAELETILETIATNANAGCGLVYELYVKRFSQEVDARFSQEPESVRMQALQIAREKFEYLSPAELDADDATARERGECCHGLDAHTCPCGCFED
jgi:hypothetical protein